MNSSNADVAENPRKDEWISLAELMGWIRIEHDGFTNISGVVYMWYHDHLIKGEPYTGEFFPPDTWDHSFKKWNPFEDIAAAMEVVAMLESRGFQWRFSRTAPVMSFHDNLPHAEFWTYVEGVLTGFSGGTATTLAEAICRAALATVSTQDPSGS